MFKKIAKILTLIIILIIFSGCDTISYSEYNLNQTAKINDFEIKLIKVSRIEGSLLEVVFEIKNNSDNTITIEPNDYFILYDINKVQIPNKYTNNVNIIKSNETITYTLQYDVTTKDRYEIYFLDKIKFNINNSEVY